MSAFEKQLRAQEELQEREEAAEQRARKALELGQDQESGDLDAVLSNLLAQMKSS